MSSSRNNSPSAQVGRTPAYMRKRKAWLASLPRERLRCVYCNRPVIVGAPNTNPLQATVEHSVEVGRRLVDPLDTAYWLLACRGCNSSRGATYQQGRDHTSERW